MAHIVKFKIAGLAGRKALYSRELNRDVNVFFGLNGSGKTSLLRILDSAMSGEAADLDRVPFEWAEVTIHSLVYKRNLVRALDKKGIATEETVLQKDVSPSERDTVAKGRESSMKLGRPSSYAKRLHWKYLSKGRGTNEQGWRHIYLPTWRLNTREDSLTSRRLRDSDIGHLRHFDWEYYFADSLNRLWSNYSNEVLTRTRKIQEDGLADILTGVLAKGSKKRTPQLDSKAAYDRVSAFLSRQNLSNRLGPRRHFEKSYKSDNVIRMVVSDIDKVERKITDARKKGQTLEDLIASMISGGKKVIFGDSAISVKTAARREIGTVSLSGGEKQAMWLFINALLAEESTLLVDEPEISLHVDWQKRLIPSMKELAPDAQLIIATHSPEIMAEVEDSNIFRI